MSMIERELIICSSEICVDTASCLNGQAWVLHWVRQWKDIPAAIEESGARVVLLELKSHDLDYLAAIERMVINHSHQEWLALASTEIFAQAPVAEMIYGMFFDFFTLPIQPEHFLTTLGHAWGMADLGIQLNNIRKTSDGFQGLIGESPAMQLLRLQIKKIATVDMPALITGPSGTGKELAAKNIHHFSSRRDAPFQAVNCGALPEKLIQSELFGHEKGAFTGSVSRKIGRIEAAQGGTLFLDEIGDLPLDAQASLLRFLQEGTIERVGNHQPIHVDARVIAATHVDLEYAVTQGRFREDLYFRLNVLRLRMPRLCERGSDIERLARHFIEVFSIDHGLKPKMLSKLAIQAMLAHSWPGNVRELMNRIRRAMVMDENRAITPECLELDTSHCQMRENTLTLSEARDLAEREVIISAMVMHGYNVAAAARKLEVSRVTLYRLMSKHGIEMHELTSSQ